MAQTFVRIGNSVGLVIPQIVREEIGITNGDAFDMEYTKEKITIKPKKKKTTAKKGINAKFAQMVDEFMEEHKDVLQELANR